MGSIPVEQRQSAYVLDHLDYAKRLAKKFYLENQTNAVEFDDLLAAAYLGLCDAADRFDSKKGVSFKTFSFLRIRGEMYDLLRKAQPQARRRGTEQKQAAAGIQASAAAGRVSEDQKSGERVVEEMGVLVRLNGGDQKIELSYLDQNMPDGSAERQSILSYLVRMVAELPADERRLIELKYFNNHSYSDICKKNAGIQKSWLSRVHKRAIAKLRQRLIIEEVWS